MKTYSEEQKSDARNVDIIDFLASHQGLTFKRSGSGYRCNEHDSLCVYSDRKGFYWNSKNTGGANAIDWLIKIEGQKFADALNTLIGEPSADYTRKNSYNKPQLIPRLSQNPVQNERGSSHKYKFKLPEKAPQVLTKSNELADDNRRVYAYLTKTRGIEGEIAHAMLHDKRLYQDKRGNCVFVGYNQQNEPKYAALRGTLSEKQFRGEVGDSDKNFGFQMKGQDNTRIYVFESPIDAMSHATIANIATGDKNAWLSHNRLSLGGLCNNALEEYLKNNPQTKEIILCLDNDEAGRNATKEFTDKYAEKGYSVRSVPPKGKDFNETLSLYFLKTEKTATVQKTATNTTKNNDISL